MERTSTNLSLAAGIIITATSLLLPAAGENQQDTGEANISKEQRFIATLPNGATVELIGFREYQYPSEGKSWWRPDGRIIETRNWPVVKDRSADLGPNRSYRRIEVALRYAGPDEPRLTGWNFNGQPRVLSASDIYSSSGCVFTFVGLVGDVDPELTKANVRVTLGYGEFGERLTGQGKTQFGSYIIGKVFDGRYIWTVLRREGMAAVSVAQDFVGRDVRVRARDKRGVWHVGKRVAERPGPLSQETFLFEGLPTNKADCVILETRLIGRITFKNVSLKPGSKTGVQVYDNPVVKPRRKPRPEGDFWEYYYVSDFLLKGGDRAEAARRYFDIAERYSSDCGKMSRELAELLEDMAEENRHFREPEDITVLAEQEQIDYYVYKLRDLAEQEIVTPGNCNVLQFPRTPDSAAVALRKIGRPAVPVLIELLDDRRPTRSVACARNGGAVLRYCDAALQILELITGQRFGDLKVKDGLKATGAYLSNIKKEYRSEIISRVKTWWANNKHKSEPEWIRDSLSETGMGMMWDRIDIAKRLIELEGARSVEFFRERLQKEPDNPRAVSLLWTAGGNAVIEDIRPKVFHGKFYVRAAAYRALVEAGEPDVVGAVMREIQKALEQADEKPDYHRALIGILTRSGEEQAISTAARLIRHPNPIVAESTLVSFQSAFERDNKPSPELRRLVFPYMVATLNNSKLRHWAAWWLINAGELPIEYVSHDRSEIERDTMIKQIEAWWEKHRDEYPRFLE